MTPNRPVPVRPRRLGGWAAVLAVVGVIVVLASGGGQSDGPAGGHGGGKPAPRPGPGPGQTPAPPTVAPATEAPGAIVLLADQAYEPRLLTLLDGATRSIDVTMFSVVLSEDAGPQHPVRRLLDRLIARAKAGVAVRVVLDRGVPPSRRRGTEDAPSERGAAYLADHGVAVRWDEEDRTTHTKSLVIDGRWCLVGSHNWSSSALRYNREQSLLVESPALAADLTRLFTGLWARATPVAP